MPVAQVEHYQTPAGRDPNAEVLQAQPPLDRAACDLVIQRLADGSIDHFSRLRSYVGDGIWELRVSSGGKQYRFLLEPLVKKTRQLPPHHPDQAKRRWRELKDRGLVP